MIMSKQPPSELKDFYNLIKEERRRKKSSQDKIVNEEKKDIVNKTLLFIDKKHEVIKPPSDKKITLNNEDLIEKTLGLISGNTTAKTSDPLTPLDQNFLTKADLDKHYKEFISRVQHQLSTVGGGGEVNFRYLDDINRSTMTTSNDNWVLEYDSTTGKAQFTNQIGPIDRVEFDITHVDGSEPEGSICWSNLDRTLNIHHQNGVVQQVGQESYFVVKNVTGSQIDNGTFCMFSGVTDNGINRLDAAPFTANGSVPNLYGIGVATENIANGAVGFVTNFGTVRGLDTTGTPVEEEWLVGDILYANPSYDGKLTRVKPTAPNNVLPVAAVVSVNSTAGEIFVRPTFEQRMDYATISSSADQSISTANTATLITYNTSEISQNISYDVSNPSRVIFNQSGLYTLDFNAQVVSTNASEKKVWFWLRKNGTDVPYSSRVVSIVGNLEYKVFHVKHNISLDANDYIEFVFASNDTAILLKAEPATAFAPAAPSAQLQIDQGAL